jgi:hypothetical protein
LSEAPGSILLLDRFPESGARLLDLLVSRASRVKFFPGTQRAANCGYPTTRLRDFARCLRRQRRMAGCPEVARKHDVPVQPHLAKFPSAIKRHHFKQRLQARRRTPPAG